MCSISVSLPTTGAVLATLFILMPRRVAAQIGGTVIEAWSPNATTASCQNKTVGGPTAGPPSGHLYYGMVCPFVNMSISGFVWYISAQ